MTNKIKTIEDMKSKVMAEKIEFMDAINNCCSDDETAKKLLVIQVNLFNALDVIALNSTGFERNNITEATSLVIDYAVKGAYKELNEISKEETHFTSSHNELKRICDRLVSEIDLNKSITLSLTDCKAYDRTEYLEEEKADNLKAQIKKLFKVFRHGYGELFEEGFFYNDIKDSAEFIEKMLLTQFKEQQQELISN